MFLYTENRAWRSSFIRLDFRDNSAYDKDKIKTLSSKNGVQKVS